MYCSTVQIPEARITFTVQKLEVVACHQYPVVISAETTAPHRASDVTIILNSAYKFSRNVSWLVLVENCGGAVLLSGEPGTLSLIILDKIRKCSMLIGRLILKKFEFRPLLKISSSASV